MSRRLDPPPVPFTAPLPPLGEGLELPEHAEDEIALLFTGIHGADLRYVATWGRWFRWDGACWRKDETLHCYDLVRDVCRERAKITPEAKHAAAVASAKTVAAVERLARADRAHAAAADQFDADPWILNTPDCTVDLQTGQARAHRREDWLTKRTAVGPSSAGAPRWFEFLKRTAGGDPELERYLQRLVGYSLTGITREHALVFFYGTGANGKSTFLNAVSGLLGEYAVIASPETFVESGAERHPTDLAMLRGARLVVAQEIDEGRRWALARIKSMTGGDPITARFVRQDFFTFTPQFKLVVSANHRPGVRNVDEAIRRRLQLVPFNQVIPAEQRDPGLAEALRTEWGGILEWAIEGCLEWQRIGLAPPQSVLTATADYLVAEDILGSWLADACIVHVSERELVGRLYESYRRWAERAGERPLSSKRFSQALEERGFSRGRITGGERVFDGLGLRDPLLQQAASDT